MERKHSMRGDPITRLIIQTKVVQGSGCKTEPDGLLFSSSHSLTHSLTLYNSGRSRCGCAYSNAIHTYIAAISPSLLLIIAYVFVNYNLQQI